MKVYEMRELLKGVPDNWRIGASDVPTEEGKPGEWHDAFGKSMVLILLPPK